MLAVERRNKISEIILEKKSVTVSKLSSAFLVTDETIRRDLKALEEDGVLKRTYGGAFIDAGVQNDISVSVRETDIVESKQRMAAVSSDFISNGDSVFLDCSTTVFHLCDFIKNMRLTVLTNSLMVLNALAGFESINLISTGGSFKNSSYSFVGKSAMQTLNTYYVDKSFISCRSVDIENGLSHSSEQQAEIYTKVLKCSEKVFLLSDHTKLGRISFIHIGDMNAVNVLVTDDTLSPEWREYLSRENIEYHESIA